jgi:hypothetical protein
MKKTTISLLIINSNELNQKDKRKKEKKKRKKKIAYCHRLLCYSKTKTKEGDDQK